MLVLEATVSHSVSVLAGSVGTTQPGHFMSTDKNTRQQLDELSKFTTGTVFPLPKGSFPCGCGQGMSWMLTPFKQAQEKDLPSQNPETQMTTL